MDSPDRRVEDLLSQMTLTEKTGQLNQRLLGFNCYDSIDGEFVPNQAFKDEVDTYGGLGFLYGLFRADPWAKKNYRNGIPWKDMAVTANRFQRYVLERSRLGIPLLISSELHHGPQSLDGYLTPVRLAMGCAFNPALLRETFEVCARQLRSSGVHIGIVPLLEVLRDARWGRAEECFSEDPYLGAVLAEAAVTGLQGRGVIDRNHAAIVANCFCANGAGAGIDAGPAVIGQRELFEIYFPNAMACVEAGAKIVMAAYNEIDGVPCHANRWLLDEILRKRFGFDGIVMADGTALDMLGSLASAPEEIASVALKAGVDVSLWDNIYPFLGKAVEAGLVPERLIDDSVRRVLKLKFEMGLFENPYAEEPKIMAHINYESCPQSLELARQSAVLLRNEGGFLPLDPSRFKTIALIGPNGDDIYNQIGDYSPSQKEDGHYTLLEGVKKIAPASEVLFARGCSIRGCDDSGIVPAVETAKKADLVILAVGGSSKRNFDIEFDATGAVVPAGVNLPDMDCGEGLDVSDLALGGVQNRLISEIESLGKPTVVVSIQGRPLCLSGITSPALICSFYPGPMGGLALAEIIFGRTVPSGKLSVSLPAYPGQTNFYYNKKASTASRNYMDRSSAALYPFGFGLSYTVFAYSDLKAETETLTVRQIENGERFVIFVTVTNRGAVDARETVQLYISAKTSPITRRVRELKGFQKILIRSGETANVTFTLGKKELGVWDNDMNFTVPKTEITLHAGTNSRETIETAIRIR
ncbi:MAG: glycoside hydrolase family 3 C-terminal domain-containing protein [Treponema sp.]|jgi:beta-glucosidase|nr:glycoside hydrolase family 3 C-terminal domain-containing protein [Treponema sp.]